MAGFMNPFQIPLQSAGSIDKVYTKFREDTNNDGSSKHGFDVLFNSTAGSKKSYFSMEIRRHVSGGDCSFTTYGNLRRKQLPPGLPFAADLTPPGADWTLYLLLLLV